MELAKSLEIIQQRAELPEQELGALFSALRFSQPLRNNWPAIRAEANILNAVYAAKTAGLVVDAMVLRKQLANPAAAQTIAETYALTQWRNYAHLDNLLPPLNLPKGVTPPRRVTRPAPQVLAELSRNWESAFPGFANFGWSERTLGTILALLESSGPALIRAALIAAEAAPLSTRQEDNLEAALTWQAGAATGMALGRLVLNQAGVEPTGIVLYQARPAVNPQEYRTALEDYHRGGPEGVLNWLRYYAQAVKTGVEHAQIMAQATYGGKPWDGFK
ncbi:hypothetical protein BSR29_00655 [Boudabousia liubingyangii]|uniref:Uncharacterized protein n=1 Tax=Boudabousia liubingyangii TaxID=1921764 RepID=A0A1Q5PQ21_9ACTO|nr:hypothetical protein [Boudabousia liubingyangii]OKL49505.1 hypothetical protein BSR29_00655 [Boudabousia liubingyangii]